ncbi:unnamed protein product [Heterobilharzia americana]|nr:unnamed protein product [Heterobilharzia americana]
MMMVKQLIGYKLPKSFDIVFMNPKQPQWKLSISPINGEGMMKKTYDAMFSLINQPDAVIGMYNDEIPKRNNLSISDSDNFWWGHMKGKRHKFKYPLPKYTQVILFKHIVCVPGKWKNIWPTSSLYYTQQREPCITSETVCCIPATISKRVYFTQYKDAISDLAELLQNRKVTTETETEVIELHTAGSTFQLKHFAKSIDFGKDLYSDFVALTLKKSLATETWQHDGGMPSDCSHQYSVTNIKSIYIDVSQTTITNSHDHSKWAVTMPPKKASEDGDNWICLGDINRQPHQLERGGGTMCIQDKHLWESFYNLIQSVEQCPRQFLHHKLIQFWSIIEIVHFYV